jgi:plasmid stability protein
MRNTGLVAKMLQVRNIPDRLHRELTKRAKARGQSLTDYVQGLLEHAVARPPADEVFDRIEARAPVKLDLRVDEVIRATRGDREAS